MGVQPGSGLGRTVCLVRERVRVMMVMMMMVMMLVIKTIMIV